MLLKINIVLNTQVVVKPIEEAALYNIVLHPQIDAVEN